MTPQEARKVIESEMQYMKQGTHIYDALSFVLSALDQAEKMKRPEGDCIHCGEFVTNKDTDHWRVCKSHPAHKKLAEQEAEIAKIDNKIAEIFYQQLKGLYAADPISALEAVKDIIDDRDMEIKKLREGLKSIVNIIEGWQEEANNDDLMLLDIAKSALGDKK